MKLKRYIKLDFTPLVDIAMILVLAYMVILYHQKSKILSMLLPFHRTCGFPPRIQEAKVVSLFLFEDHIIFIDGYDEVEHPFNKTGYSIANFKKILTSGKKTNTQIVVIKPRNSSNYGNLVLIINHCKRFNIRYALVPYFTQDEEQMLSQAEKMFSKPLVVIGNMQ